MPVFEHPPQEGYGHPQIPKLENLLSSQEPVGRESRNGRGEGNNPRTVF